MNSGAFFLQILRVDVEEEGDRQFWEKHNPAVLAMASKGKGGAAMAYVCANFTCQAPTQDPKQLEKLLAGWEIGEGKRTEFDLKKAFKL